MAKVQVPVVPTKCLRPRSPCRSIARVGRAAFGAGDNVDSTLENADIRNFVTRIAQP